MRTEPRPEPSAGSENTDISGFKECFQGGKLRQFICNRVYVGSTVIMRPTRRKTLVGLGALATGSGAIFSSAAFSNSVSPTSDLRVVVEENLEVRKGPGFDVTSSVYTNESAFFDGDDIDDSASGAFNSSSPALAYVNDDVNDNLVIKAAQNVGVPSFTFSEIIEIGNTTADPVDVGIAYDRGASSSQYGDDVENGNLGYDVAQRVYQFQANSLDSGNAVNYAAGSGNLISPDPNGAGVTAGTNNSVSEDNDKPAAAVTIPSGDILSIDLVVDTASDSTAIEDEAGLSGDFGSDRGTVDILDAITVGKFEGL